MKVTDEMIKAAKSAYWHEVHHGAGYSDECYRAALEAALPAVPPVMPPPSTHLRVPNGWMLVPIDPTTEMECAPNHEDCATPDAAKAVYRAMLSAAPPSPLDIVTVEVIHPASSADVPCDRCQGNGEIVTDWERYRHPHAGDVGDEAVAECPDCNGEGRVEANPSPQPNVAVETVRALETATVPKHPDDIAVDRFAAAMKAKLAKKRDDGRGGWEDKGQCSNAFLSELLLEHVAKGDPVDVGNLAMMVHQRGESICVLTERVAAISQLHAIVDAWEALPGGRQVRNSDVEHWLAKHMGPGIDAIRGFLRRPRPDGILPPSPQPRKDF